jgi:membrane associated rhomboid family serine protease
VSDIEHDDEQGSSPGQTGHGRGRSEEQIEDFELHMPDDLDVHRCYRHPDRETGVSCSNCGRPICYECMTPAPVGFRCPECMAEQRGGLRSVGGTGGVRTPRRRPTVITRQQTRARWQSGLGLGTYGATNQVTRILVGINVLMFIVELVVSGGGFARGVSTRALVDLGGLVPAYVATRHEYWRLVTAMFLHASLWHILFNMWALWVVGSYLEAIAGRGKYLIIYFVSGLAGNVLAYLFGPPYTVMIGASTAIFGLFGALFIYSYNNRHTMAGMMLRSIGFVIVINLIFTFMVSSISWQGHVGGLLGGVAVMEALSLFGRKDPRAPFEARDLSAVAALVVLLVVAVAWRTLSF